MISTPSSQPSGSSTRPPSWSVPSAHPLLSEDEVHIWRADLTAVTDDLTTSLSRQEHARAARFPHERKRRLWARARGVLRALLGGYLRMDPSALCFTAGSHGKPALVARELGASETAKSAPLDPSRLSFNLAHSGALALYALTREPAVGVDVEVARRPDEDRAACVDIAGSAQAIKEHRRRPIDEVALAGRAFGPEKARSLEELQPVAREREFLRSWVRHEAALKCLGTGICVRPSGESGCPAGNSAAQGDSRPDRAGISAKDLWVAELDVGSRAVAAVALEEPPLQLRCWEWRAVPGAIRLNPWCEMRVRTRA